MKKLLMSGLKVAFATTLGLIATAPAIAMTTITLTTPVDHTYYKAPGSSQFSANSPLNSNNGAAVGRFSDSSPTVNGDYASTMEFLIPALPSDATITGLTLTLHPFPQIDGHGNFGLGDVQLRSYVAANTASDPNRLFAGNNLTNYFDLNAHVVTADLLRGPLAGPTVNYVYADPGQYLGFAFRETSAIGNCTICTSYTTLDFPPVTNATLTITYEVPAVPEPATWAMFIVGCGLVGAAVRRDRWRSA